MPSPLNLTDEDILDAELRASRVYIILRDGRRLELPASKQHIELYWRVKIRNRRRAFGI